MSDRICLVVNDEPSICKLVQFILEGESLTCRYAETASEALEIVQRIGGSIDLLVTEIRMGEQMDGIALARSVRAILPGLPVLLMSDIPEHTSGISGSEFLRRPFHAEELWNAVRKLIPGATPGDAGNAARRRNSRFPPPLMGATSRVPSSLTRSQ